MSLRVLFCYFFREKKVEFFSSKTTVGRERVRRVSLSGFLFRRILCCSLVVYRPSDFVWWWWSFGGVERLLLRSTCAFSLGVVQVKLFFPLLYRRRACVYYHHTQEQKRSHLS